MPLNSKITTLRTTLLLLALLCLALTHTLLAQPIRTITWNIEWFPGGKPKATQQEKTAQIQGAKKAIEKLSPQILLAQELGDKTAFEEIISTTPGMKLHTFSNFLGYDHKTPSPHQCAIASTLTAHSAWFEEFKPVKGIKSLTRGFAFAALNHPEGGLILVYSIHLKSNNGGHTPQGAKNVAATRAESIRQIIAHKTAMAEKFHHKEIIGYVIGGDFNTNHDSQFPICTAISDTVKAGFHNSWDKTPKQTRQTWLSHPDPEKRRFQPTTFDYIFTSGFQEKQATIPPGIPRKTSDHAPVEILLIKK